MRFCVFTLFILGLVSAGHAQAPYSDEYVQNFTNQTDQTISALTEGDSAKWDGPKKATMLALMLPGAGQIYNKKYWKAGIVYAGIGGLIYMNKYNRDSLKKYQAILVSKIDGDSNTLDLDPNRTTASITSDRDFHRRYRDISILGFVGLYALQVIDVHVDAHLKEFSVNPDLAVRIRPDIYAVKPGIGMYNGLTVSFRF